MTAYAALQKKAHDRILLKGAMTTLQWDSPATPDVVAGTAGTGTPVTGAVALCAFPLSRRFLASDTYEQQTLILQRSRLFLMSAFRNPVTPRQGMKVIGWENKTWTIDSIGPLTPDGVTTVMYEGTMRQ